MFENVVFPKHLYGSEDVNRNEMLEILYSKTIETLLQFAVSYSTAGELAVLPLQIIKYRLVLIHI